MKNLLLFLVWVLLIPATLVSQVKINEVVYNPSTGGDMIELKNFGGSSVDVSSMWFCSQFSYSQINTLTVESGSTTIPPGEFLVLSGRTLQNSADLGFYNDINGNTGNFGVQSFMEDFVQWGGSGQGRESVAVSKGIWPAGDFVPTPADGHSLEYDGDGNASSDWFDQDNPTIGSENGVLTSVESDLAGVPDGFNLAQNYPNPFNPSTQINYAIARSGRTQLEIFNILGAKVRTLINQTQPGGNYSVRWDGTNDTGEILPSGVYVYQLRIGTFMAMRKMLLVK